MTNEEKNRLAQYDFWRKIHPDQADVIFKARFGYDPPEAWKKAAPRVKKIKHGLEVPADAMQALIDGAGGRL